MIEDVIIEFQSVTKFPLIEYLSKYRNFMLDSYPALNRYFSGEDEKIDNSHMTAFNNLLNESKNVMSQFKNFSNKFSNCGYWELMEYLDGLNDTLEKINKLPKFRRTCLGKRGYLPSVEVQASVGDMRTMEDVANSVRELNSDNTDWVDLMLNNDLNEFDWEIDSLSGIKVFINNKTDVVVTTIIDIPIGSRIYGKDVFRKIDFEENDLKICEFENNIEQKCNILLELNRGDVPENMLFGKHLNLIGSSVKQYGYSELINDITNNFMQNDLFEYVSVNSFNFNNGDLIVSVDIKTKYDYKTTKEIAI